ncbi:MAG TPA: hypothetical protein VE912_21110 [Bacteroidales bacterium]|nr:hypothetical protein [Bacteroidales bacterium]
MQAIIAAILIQVLLKGNSSAIDTNLVEFFSGLALGAGGSILVVTIFNKK